MERKSMKNVEWMDIEKLMDGWRVFLGVLDSLDVEDEGIERGRKGNWGCWQGK